MATYQGEQGWEQPNYAGAKSGGPHDQYLRKWSLSLGKAVLQNGIPIAQGGPSGADQIVVTTSDEGYDLRMHFEVRHADLATATPNTAVITVYNLKNSTAAAIVQEYNYITLQAGYKDGKFGVIFQGTVKQFKRGRESAVDSYLTIFASDGDLATNYGVVNTTLPAGWTYDQLRDTIIAAQERFGATRGNVARDPNGGLINARPYVMSGMAVDEAVAYAATTRQSWTIQNGKIQIQPLTAYMPGDVAVINAATGMIGVPELTESGLQLTCLLNPMLYIKQRIQIDNGSANNELVSVNQYFAPGGGRLAGTPGTAFPNITAPGPVYASTAADGMYCIMVIDHEGDTRGLEWYSKIVALNVDATVTGAQSNQVPAGDTKDGPGDSGG